MAENKSNSNLAILERDRMSLDNAENQSEIAENLSEVGYGPDELVQGKDYLNAAWVAYDNCRVESDETNAAYAAFSQQKMGLDSKYTLMRKKAKVVFRKEPLVLEALAVSVEKPRIHVRWIDGIRIFCKYLLQDEEALLKMGRLKVTKEDIVALLAECDRLDELRSVYLKEKGESQHATKVKDDAMLRLDDWMRDFYAVAKIAMEDKPQLLESLGLYVKS